MMHASCSECGAQLATSLSASEPPFDLNVAPGTRHHKLLNTNEPPEDPVEVNLVQSVVSKIAPRLACLNHEISRLRDRLEQLEAERALLSSYLAQNNAILSPLRRMPSEVLGEIFSWTLLPAVRDASKRGRFDVTDSPWLLTHISSHWRAVSLSTPSLWSVITVDYRRHSYPSSFLLPMLETQIQRAQTLHIYFYAASDMESSPQEQVFEFLAKHSSRWEVLNLVATRALLPLVATLHHRVPLLRRLWLQSADKENRLTVDSITSFRVAPSLVESGVCDKYRFISVPLPVYQLTRYDLDGPLEMHLNVLKLAKNLVEARIFVDIGEVTSLETVDVLSLRRLYVVSSSAILDYIRTPALEEIALLVGDDKSDPCLESLLVRSSYEVNTLISNFTISDLPGSTPVAPQLLDISFGCEDDNYIDYTVYLDMLESRWKAKNCALKATALLTYSGPGPDSETLDGLDLLRHDGLDVFLLEGTKATEVVHGWMYFFKWIR
ncbi:hypothetical protein C8R44DRAFT_898607 [Mycena epipterygia]|nr:hypothetical protein C8R44DRAFT_898607 [Mycena epipterygia]